jgi:cysteine desulfurase / selenocysteine lyase
MSTSERDGSTPPTGWPDVATLERLANELFATMPGTDPLTSPVIRPGGFPEAGPSTASSQTALKSISNDLVADVALTSTEPISVGLPGEAELRELMQSLAATAGVPGGSPQAPPARGLPEASLSPTGVSFYFLGDAGSGPARALSGPAPGGSGLGRFDVNLARRDFPILQERINGRPLVWLDNAATTQKPQAVIDRLDHFYRHENSNVHRAAHELAARATDAYEAAREKVRAFLNASSTNEIVFLRGATEAINLVAQSWGRQHVGQDDEIVISWLEHHANIVPWQQLANETGARLKVIPVDNDGQIVLGEYGKLLGPKTKIVSFAHVSNALGTITPARQMVEMAHSVGARVLLDGAQAVSHMRVDVQALDPDWYAFSGHKVFGPTGIGALFGKESLLNQTQPWQGGGSMIKDVTFERTLYQNAPARFEAGTGNIADAVGLGAAIDYVTRIGLDIIDQYEHQLLAYATRLLNDIPGLRIIGTAPAKASVLSFVLGRHKTEDIGAALNREGIAVRAGHHCAQPILRRFGVETTVRASLALYNTCADVDALVSALTRLASSRSIPSAPPPGLTDDGC